MQKKSPELFLDGCAFWSVGVFVVLGTMLVLVAPDTPQEPVLAPGVRPLVIIDAGHGGKDDGAKVGGLVEKELTLDLAFRLEGILKKRGFSTQLTRRDDRFVRLSERAAMANSLAAPNSDPDSKNNDRKIAPPLALFVSLHFNTGQGKNTNGIETFYASKKRPAARSLPECDRWKWLGFFPLDENANSGEYLAADVQLGVVNQTGARNRGIRGRSLHVTRETTLPAILIEGGFMTDPMEARLLKNPEYLDRIATGIADGIVAWSGALPTKEIRPRGPVALSRPK